MASLRVRVVSCLIELSATLADNVKAVWMGLQDHYDVKLQCHLLLAKLAAAAPGQLLANLPRLTDPLEKTLQTKVKADAVKQEVRTVLSASCIGRWPQPCACLLQQVSIHCCVSCPDEVLCSVGHFMTAA